MRRVDLKMVSTATVAVASGMLLLAAPAAAQSIAERVAAVEDGQVRLSFAAREGVCGSGRTISWSRGSDDWEPRCDPGPVHVAIDVRSGRIVDIDTYVGGHWSGRSGRIEALGMVSAPEAARYFLSLAGRLSGEVARDAIFPATLADSVVVWPDLLALAKDRTRPEEVRKGAVFWVAQAAGAAVTEGLEAIVTDESDDIEVRESAIFAISQLPHEEGVPVLLRLVQEHRDPRIRRQAIFWLGQSGDPRAIALFEEILTRP